MATEAELKALDDLIARHLYWRLPIIAMQARKAAAKVLDDAKIDPEDLRRPMTI